MSTFRYAGLVLGAVLSLPAFAGAPLPPVQTPHPILYVTQFPIKNDFCTAAATFCNHFSTTASVGRGGDLMLRYTDGTLRNLTREAGFGTAAVDQHTAQAIAVRDPAVHWDGQRAVFSMVVGGVVERYREPQTRWQLYEVAGPGLTTPGGAIAITKVPSQPTGYNNIQPTYDSADDIIFVSDRPRSGASHHYPQLDEYETRPVVSGLWKLERDGDLYLMQHSPSGSFDPLVDRFGRVVFTRWDHLQRDQQNGNGTGGNPNGTFNFASEAANAERTESRAEIFPEARFGPDDNVPDHSFNQFFPWQIRQDGTEEETLNHLGRHELLKYFERSFTDDGTLGDFGIDPANPPANVNPVRIGNGGGVGGMQHIYEDPRGGAFAGCFVASNVEEFRSHSAAQLVSLCAPPTMNPEDIRLKALTPSFFGFTPGVALNGRYRNPMILSDGTLVAVHAQTNELAPNQDNGAPDDKYKFRLKTLALQPNGFYAPARLLTSDADATRHVRFFDPDLLIDYNGEFWEMSPVEVRARTRPPATLEVMANPEQAAFAAAGVDPDTFRNFLRERGLALLVMRNVTTREARDRQQPFNLRVPGGESTVRNNGAPRDITHMQFVQADAIRGIGGRTSPDAGRRSLAQFLHDVASLAENIVAFAGMTAGPAGSVPIFAADGSVAAFVPARRALSWQAVSPTGTPVIRERYWISLQPGEVRACDGCHGVNRTNQAGETAAQNTPVALVTLLDRWLDANPQDILLKNGFE